MLKLIRGSTSIPVDFPGCVATIGNFDGMHLGHQVLVRRLLQKSAELRLPSVLITFEPQPNEFFVDACAIPARLTCLREKWQALQAVALDYMLCLRFNAKLANLSAADFMQHILIGKLKVAHVIVGDDFHFGHQRAGNVQALRSAGVAGNFSTESMPSYRVGGVRVSSSQIRSVLRQGDFDAARALLGREYSMSGRVMHGKKQGRCIGFPTANVAVQRKVVPLGGVYAVKVAGLADCVLCGVANIGDRPTVSGARTLLEVHLFDFNADIYGKIIQVIFMKKLREEQRFDSLELLRQQIVADAQQARSYFQFTC